MKAASASKHEELATAPSTNTSDPRQNNINLAQKHARLAHQIQVERKLIHAETATNIDALEKLASTRYLSATLKHERDNLRGEMVRLNAIEDQVNRAYHSLQVTPTTAQLTRLTVIFSTLTPASMLDSLFSFAPFSVSPAGIDKISHTFKVLAMFGLSQKTFVATMRSNLVDFNETLGSLFASSSQHSTTQNAPSEPESPYLSPPKSSPRIH